MIRRINTILKTFQPIINTIGILLVLIGIYLTLIQVFQANIDFTRNVYKFNGEQYPTVKFKILDKKLGVLKTDILQSDMLFQSARVSYHDSLLKKQELILMHDSIWYNTTLFCIMKGDKDLKLEFGKLMDENKFHSFINIRTPVMLEINYVKYGESRMIPGLFELEFSYFKNYRNNTSEFESEIRAVYFKRYLDPQSGFAEEIQELNKFEIVNGA